ncbi:MAG: hypothetical protein CL745_00890 [Chloroflexi bacterium]|nr:hypothetical protein [Chloroflexota bacterium]|tara:strand:+ start:34260 stop:34670 length:411 start_codon:yes stop_codon:yes gene_type:complete
MDKISFVKSGNKELAIHGDYLRFKDDDSIKDIVVDKITSISIEGLNNQYSKLLWAILGFLSSIISWYFLEESLLSTLVSILSLIGGLIFFISYFVFSFYSKITIKTSRIDIVLEFSELKKNKILEFKKTLLSKISN